VGACGAVAVKEKSGNTRCMKLAVQPDGRRKVGRKKVLDRKAISSYLAVTSVVRPV